MKNNQTTYFGPIEAFYFLVLFDFLFFSVQTLDEIATAGPVAIIYPNILFFLTYFRSDYLATFLLMAAFFIHLFCFLRPQKRLIRFLSFAFFFIVKGFAFSYLGRFMHGYWAMLWVLLFFSIPKNEPVVLSEDKVWRSSYNGAIFSCLFFYFAAGVQKIYFGLIEGVLFQKDYMVNLISYYLVSHSKVSILGRVLVEAGGVTYFLMIPLLIFQVSAGYIFYNKKYLKYWSLCALLFHLCAIFVLQINYFILGLTTFVICYFVPIKTLKAEQGV